MDAVLMRCPNCGRHHGANTPETRTCKCGTEIVVESSTAKTTRRARKHLLDCIAICRRNECGNWGENRRGQEGCLLHPLKPCGIESHLISGGGCFAEQPLFNPANLAEITLPQFRWSPAKITSELAVVTVAVGRQAHELAEFTLPRIKQYATRCKADCVVIDNDQCPDWPIGNKFAVESVANRYARTLFIDIDCWIADDCPDLFATFAPGAIYMHKDRPCIVNDKWLDDEAKRLGRKGMRLECYNTGVVLFDVNHSSIWKPPDFAFEPTHTSEQSWVEIQAREQGHEIKELPTEFNLQWWMRPTDDQWGGAHVRHLASASHQERLCLLRLWVLPGHL